MCCKAKLELARNERDALMSFITLLLLPVIHLHSKSVLKVYSLQQNLAAMKRQAQNAAMFNETLLTQQADNKKDKKDEKKDNDQKDNDDIDTKMLRDELLLYKARLTKSDKRCKELESELNATREQMEKYDELQNAAKKKT